MREKSKTIQTFIINLVAEGQENILQQTADEFGITKQAVSLHIKQLLQEHVLESSGNGAARTFSLRNIVEQDFTFLKPFKEGEDDIWREYIRPQLGPYASKNVLAVCQHGITEMVNNVLDHSSCKKYTVSITIDAQDIELCVEDDGIGIFRNVQEKLNLPDPRLSLLELAKGKLTTAPQYHSGEGIFFTSRIFNTFYIVSGGLTYSHTSSNGDTLIDSTQQKHTKYKTGTRVEMKIRRESDVNIGEIFNAYTFAPDDYNFSKTVVPIKLAEYDGDLLVSRSQAKRLLARFEKFKVIHLDFKGVEAIGQAFSDEIFRVFASAHPEVQLEVINANQAVQAMVFRAKSHR